MHRMLRGFLRAEDGQDLVEYAILAALIATVTIAALRLLGEQIPRIFSQVQQQFPLGG